MLSLASFGFSSPGTATEPPARTSTAGAAATWRTVRRAPLSEAEVSFTNGVRVGVPSALRWATMVMFAPAGTATSLASITAAPSAPAPAATTFRS